MALIYMVCDKTGATATAASEMHAMAFEWVGFRKTTLAEYLTYEQSIDALDEDAAEADREYTPVEEVEFEARCPLCNNPVMITDDLLFCATCDVGAPVFDGDSSSGYVVRTVDLTG